MESDPGKNTSDRQFNSNDAVIEFKREPAVKDEPSDEWKINLTQARLIEKTATNVMVKFETDSDSELGEVNCLKMEVKTEQEKSAKGSNLKTDEDTNGNTTETNIEDDRNGRMASNNEDIDGLNANVSRKGHERSRKQNKSMISRNQTTKIKKKLKCQLCDYVTSYKCDLTRHLRIHTGEKPIKCDISLKNFSHKSSLMRHKKTHGPNLPFRCSRCYERFELKAEKLDHEGKCQRRQFECDLCKFTTYFKSNLEMHMRIHSGEKPFQCSVCIKAFAQNKNMKSHLRTHVNELRFACKNCGQRFADGTANDSHLKQCKQRRYECFLCQYESFYKTHTKRHMQAKHTAERAFQCTVCDKEFAQKMHLNRHLGTHRDQYPFRCLKCHRGFSEEDKRRFHEERCNFRQYQCHLCYLFLKRKPYLIEHLRSHHTGSKPFHCEKWEIRFLHRNTFLRHVKRIHGATN